MRSASRLSVALLALALGATPALADANPRAPTSMIEPIAAPSVTSDADRYAAREVADSSVAEFRGGKSSVTIIGVSTLSLVLIIILIVILL